MALNLLLAERTQNSDISAALCYGRLSSTSVIALFGMRGEAKLHADVAAPLKQAFQVK
jgi:hypothetical protein